jgi:hypothetical protein
LGPPLGITDPSVDGLTAAGAAVAGMPQVDAEAFTHAADQLARQLVGPSHRSSYACAPSAPDDGSCAGQIVEALGRRLFRRALTPAQRDSYVALVVRRGRAEGDFWLGLHAGLAAMLQSPYFLFRVESSAGRSDDPNLLDGPTLASRLSYLIWGSGPDEALLALGESGELHDPAVLQAQADRLLADVRAERGLYDFFIDLLQLGRITTAQKDPNDYSPELAGLLRQQVDLTLIDLLLTRNADYRTLFTSADVFVNDELARRYGYPAVDASGFKKITFLAQDRAGLFGLPGITTMLSPSSRSSPTIRGLYIRGVFLCTAVPSPPATVNTTIVADTSAPRTMRQIMAVHATNSACSGCHALMDPMGFAIDDFDWLGHYRTTDAGLPLDLTGSLDGRPFVNARTFGGALHDDPAVAGCLVQKFLLHATGRAFAGSDPLVVTLLGQFSARGYGFKDLVRAFVQSQAFVHA